METREQILEKQNNLLKEAIGLDADLTRVESVSPMAGKSAVAGGSTAMWDFSKMRESQQMKRPDPSFYIGNMSNMRKLLAGPVSSPGGFVWPK